MRIENLHRGSLGGRSGLLSLPLMGIENPAPVMSEPICSSTLLPLMGIENAAQPAAVERQILLITPHGDRKHAAIPPTRSKPNSSLPLMGIENVQGQWRSISPFGDSLPLMGIENAMEKQRDRDNAVDSLPLMGIENPTAPSGAAVADTPHYPSWGSKTRRTRRRPSPRQAPAHYPSWGSKTPNRRALAKGYADVSLPLMGIENFAPRTRASVTSSSSLPLMGIENAPGRRQAGARTTAHYPSWGSKTTLGVQLAHTVTVPLITPHGDRKPGRADRRDRRPSASHYPSWGSKTRPTASTPRSQHSASLPLMGIENAAAAAGLDDPGLLLITPHGDRKLAEQRPETTHVGVSLPLMGIENAADVAEGVGLLAGLITPHGDRKPGDNRNCASAWRAENSLPLMGIENPPRWRRSRPAPSCSLPLMGIENYEPPGRTQRRPALITPHGDRKPSILTESGGSSGSVAAGGEHPGCGRSPRWARFVRLSLGPERVLCSGAGAASHKTDQFFPCQPSSC